ncbi:DUF4129 domain-containing protein [uncultured Nocardioides sp.]|uniref:DUF4129 domain-containing protein n=1 Tax=uncultured Nocardioides sp. TaxID=198441 RepID=UPI0025E67028|nr:DUF4129 domain-containing protein [uncultured Nocardioides sp.]
MTRSLPLAPLDPSPDEARSLLRRELLRPEYNDQDLLGRLLDWLQRTLDRGLDAASRVPALSTFVAMLVLCLLVLALAWLVSRARGSAAADRAAGPVLTDERVSAAELRARAEAALAEGRADDALVDGFRALAVRQVERGRLPEAPGTTAREVARDLGAAVPALAPRAEEAATRFDLVLYGGRPATREQAVSVLALDDDLVGVR